MQRRHNMVNYLLLAGMLLQEYIVDAYLKVESGRLNWQRNNQNTLRADLYRGLQDAVEAGDNDMRTLGRRVVLSSSFIGGPRAMRQLYQDAMSVVTRHGKPDLFITFTCNPRWPEITENLQPGQDASNRPDLVARVFNLKVKELIEDIVDNKVFGPVKAYFYVIEFQKRGLPHLHLLLMLQNKPTTVEDYDRIVSAEIPDPVAEPDLHAKVVRHMVHGPCGRHNRACKCMEDDKCTKHYPKEFCEETLQGANGYAQYRRRKNGRTWEVRGVTIDNTWIVPYNRALLLKYDAHVNVEVSSGVAVVKYLYKYLCKGPDRGLLAVGSSDRDEVQRFVDGRYISAAEAAWRLFHFPLSDTHPSVTRLQVHLEGEHTVTFNPDGTVQEAAAQAERAKSTLMAWFDFNAANPDAARDVTYAGMVKDFRFNPRTREWTRRQRHSRWEPVGRIYFVLPSAGERYYLRLLLNHVTGATCFKDVRTYDDVEYATFREAAMARGLLRGDEEWDRALLEAGAYQMPNALRGLFVSILVFCAPDAPRTLWEDHALALSDDFLHERRQRDRTRELSEQETKEAKCDALRDIEVKLAAHHKTLADFGLPAVAPAGPRIRVPALEAEALRWNPNTLQQQVKLAKQNKHNLMFFIW